MTTSLLNTTLVRDIEPGSYITRIRTYNEVNIEGRQPYVSVEMLIDDLIVTDRWYSSRIPYIMKCLRKQYHKDYMDVTLSQLLNMCKDQDFVVNVSYNAKYGRQIDYREEVD